MDIIAKKSLIEKWQKIEELESILYDSKEKKKKKHQLINLGLLFLAISLISYLSKLDVVISIAIIGAAQILSSVFIANINVEETELDIKTLKKELKELLINEL